MLCRFVRIGPFERNLIPNDAASFCTFARILCLCAQRPDLRKQHDFNAAECASPSIPYARQYGNAAHARDEGHGPKLKKASAPFYKHLFAGKLWAYYPRR
jgi:hypothetical protein